MYTSSLISAIDKLYKIFPRYKVLIVNFMHCARFCEKIQMNTITQDSKNLETNTSTLTITTAF